MFTGLIEDVGRVRFARPSPGGSIIEVETALTGGLQAGDSVAVNGVCLTATRLEGRAFTAEIGPETLQVTTLGSLEAGRGVNLERALRPESRLGGHLMQGHVDGTAVITEIRVDGEFRWLSLDVPEVWLQWIVPKGSVAVDGVSLTVARVSGRALEIMLIPFTWSHTRFPEVATGDRVNVECDMIGKYVARAAEAYRGRIGGVSTTENQA